MKDSKRYNKALADFMKAKAKNMPSVKTYFTAKDALDIMKWSNVLAKQAWYILNKRIKNSIIAGLPGYTCPYCIVDNIRYEAMGWKSCNACLYGKRHGQCDDDNSDFYQIMHNFIITGIYTRDIFPHTFYDKLIERLKKKYKL